MPEPFPRLFGGAARTRILISLLFDGDQPRRELARCLGIEPSFALDRLRSLERSGIAKRTTGQANWTFDWSFPASREIAAILERYANRRAVEPDNTASASAIHRGWEELLVTPTRTAMLIAIARYSSRTLVELESDTEFSRDSLRSAADSLIRGGVLASGVIRHSRHLWLNPKQPAYPQVNRLLLALNEHPTVATLKGG